MPIIIIIILLEFYNFFKTFKTINSSPLNSFYAKFIPGKFILLDLLICW